MVTCTSHDSEHVATCAWKMATNELSCSVCLGGFREPKVLPCCHSFCLQCLEGALEKSLDHKNITCPQCRTQHQVPTSGVRGFLTDYSIQTSSKETRTAHFLTCQQCSENAPAVAYCSTCFHLCEECLRAHKQLKILQSHQVEMGVSSTQTPPKRVYNCDTHPDEHLKLYCQDCRTLACLLCFISSHNGHNIGSINAETRKKAKGAIKQLVETAEMRLANFEESLQYIREVEKSKAEELEPLKAEINRTFDTWAGQLESRRSELISSVEATFTQDQKQVWAEKEQHETAIVSMKGALSFARRTLLCQEDTELLVLYSQVIERLKILSVSRTETGATEKLGVKGVLFKFQGGIGGQSDSCILQGSGEIITVSHPVGVTLHLHVHNEHQEVVVGTEARFQVTAQLLKTPTFPTKRKKSKSTLAHMHKKTQLQSPLERSGSFSSLTTNRQQQAQQDEVDQQIKLTAYHIDYNNHGNEVMCECTEGFNNEWTVSFTPTIDGNTSVTVEAKGRYKLGKVENRHTFNTNVALGNNGQ